MDVGTSKPPFTSYFPTDVKQRRRTSRAQVIVLEDAYSRTTKPDGPLRVSLAERLDMTPRGVQVWFQNRRAKDKMLRKKATLDWNCEWNKTASNLHSIRTNSPSIRMKQPCSTNVRLISPNHFFKIFPRGFTSISHVMPLHQQTW
jgi:hypothetical protein